MEEGFKFRAVINENVVAKIAKDIHSTWNKFDKEEFCHAINPELPQLSFNARSLLVTENLYKFLPDDYPTAIEIILDSFGPELTKKN